MRKLLIFLIACSFLVFTGTIYGAGEDYPGKGDTISTSGTPVDNDFAKFTDADTIEGRSPAEAKEDLDLEVGTDFNAYIKVKLDATAAPGVTNDTDEGYAVGSHWFDVTTDKGYICLDKTDGAAVWTETTQSGSTPAWGDVTGTLSNQTDLQTAFDARCLESVFGTAIGAGLTLDSTTLKTHTALQSLVGLTEADVSIIEQTGADAYAVAAHGLTYSDVGAEQSGVSVLETDYNADTFMYATADNTPVATSPANVLAALSGYAGADFDFNGQYATQLQNIPDLASKGAGYWFDGVNDVIAVADNADLDPGTGDFSILVAFKAGSQGAVGLFDRHSGTNYIRLTLNADGTFTQLFRVYPGSPTSFVSGGTYNDNNNHIVCVTYDRDALAQLYGDGIPDGSVNIAANAASFDISTVLSIGSLTLSNFLKGQISRTLLFNLVLSATEVEAFSSGASVPYKYIGASQTGLSTSTLVNNVAHDYETFDGASATGFHAINATYYGIAQTVDEVVLKIGKRYRVSFSAAIVSGTPGVYVMSASVGNVAVSGSATQTIVSGLNVYEFTSGVSDTCVLYWQTNDGVAAEYTISNFAITQIGCVLQLEQSGITDATWYDSSGNDLDGTVSGAVAINLPDVDAHLASLGITATVAQINATCNP